MRILLFGANGQVGHALRDALAHSGELICATRSGRLPDGALCELADFDQPRACGDLVARVSPDVVINAAAYTAVDRAEQQSPAAFRTNAEAPGEIAGACARTGALLVHYSTDYVFDGTRKQPWREGDETAPLGVYGASKLEGERRVRHSGARHMVFRAAWVYGLHGHNFMRTMLGLAAEREELRVVADQFGTPTPATLIARITADVLRTRPRATGLWHLTATGSTSWFGFAKAIIDGAYERGQLARKPKMVPISTAEYPTPARRPQWSCLSTEKLRSDFRVALPSWDDALGEVLDDRSLRA